MTLELDVAHGPAKEEFYAESFTVSQRARVEDDIRIRVETNGVRYRVSVETDLASNDLLLHWGVAETKERWDEWKNPPEKIRPKLTREIVGVCQTKFTSGPAQRFGSSKLQTTIEGDVIDGFYAINFVLYDKKLDQWIHNKQGGFWHVHLPQPPQPETVTRTVTRTEEYEDEIEEEEEYEEEVEEEEETASTPMVNLDLHAQASVDAPVKEEAISSSSLSTTTTPSNTWRRLLTPPVDPKPFTGASDDIDSLMQSLMAERQGSTDEKPATSAANGRDDGENDDRDDNEGEEDAIVRDVDEKPPKKLKRGTRMVKRSIMRTRSVTDSVEEPLPVKLVEGPWLVTNTMRETVASEREVQFQIGALVEKDPEGGGVRLRIEAEVPWNLVLHWGIVPRGARTDVWALPPEMWRPDGSVVHKDKACETRMIRAENPLDAEKSISFAELELGNAPTAIRFVLKEDGGSRWIDFNGDDFVIPMPEAMYASSTLDLTGERSKEAMSVAAAAAARAAERKLDTSTLEPLVDSASEYDVDVATTTTIPEKTTTEIARNPSFPSNVNAPSDRRSVTVAKSCSKDSIGNRARWIGTNTSRNSRRRSLSTGLASFGYRRRRIASVKRDTCLEIITVWIRVTATSMNSRASSPPFTTTASSFWATPCSITGARIFKTNADCGTNSAENWIGTRAPSFATIQTLAVAVITRMAISSTPRPTSITVNPSSRLISRIG